MLRALTQNLSLKANQANQTFGSRAFPTSANELKTFHTTFSAKQSSRHTKPAYKSKPEAQYKSKPEYQKSKYLVPSLLQRITGSSVPRQLFRTTRLSTSTKPAKSARFKSVGGPSNAEYAKRAEFQSILHRAFNKYCEASKRHPSKVAAATAITVSFAGNCTCQLMDDSDSPIELSRALSQAAFQATTAMWLRCQFYPFLDRLIPGTSLGAVLFKVGTEEGVNTPLWWGFGFNMYTNLLDGGSIEDGWEKVRSHGWDSMVLSWWVWGPAQTITFACVPPHLRVLWISSVNFIYSMLVSQQQQGLTDKSADESCDMPELQLATVEY
mmetsp:Transcript_39282/g.47574  ORF Transcript_39282/g.47574 Transcript_39282/m.47574 type:complete len:325 (-) Transcript_39282:667-1641(-)|eukprot:CAMPEP_0197847262 /NCGR_PEP_ID=MMETSP1438-20131217/5674_1 /TAXON_ID=1461541 /ORGANISM="Pterosperma sp., Strain CCMP1384" /LENGTH=324 /DNA_ID=CAMNT_0043459133 /DNA_START=650 /DNA_END=1624 /DNA_ORIENTATION=-